MREDSGRMTAVQAAVRCVYLPWLEDTARHFQKCLVVKDLPAVAQQEGIAADAGECILFADGLRFDIGQRLVAMAGERHIRGVLWLALGGAAHGDSDGQAGGVAGCREASRRVTWRPTSARRWPTLARALTTDRFRKLLSAEGLQVIGPAESGDARAKNARGWTEYGEFDKLGHNLQGKLAARIEDQLELLLERVQGLLGGRLEAGARGDRPRLAARTWRDAEGATAEVPGREPLVAVRVDQGQFPRGGAHRRLVVEPAGAVRLRAGSALLRRRTGICPRGRELAGVSGSRS